MFQMAPLAPSRGRGEEYSGGGLGETLLSILANNLRGEGMVTYHLNQLNYIKERVAPEGVSEKVNP